MRRKIALEGLRVPTKINLSRGMLIAQYFTILVSNAGGRLFMSKPKQAIKLVASGLAALALCLSVGAAVAAPVTGAIFTTDVFGTFVDANIYNAKEDVFLNGGPRSPKAPCTAAGLPDGWYAFQVTDPSGQTVLSSSSEPLSERTVFVSGGVITAYAGSHITGDGKCGSKTVELMPFYDTPNPGGEYKVWMAPYNADGSFSGFVPSQSKTDNFKVVPCTDPNACGPVVQ
jgi:hypothetical protein